MEFRINQEDRTLSRSLWRGKSTARAQRMLLRGAILLLAGLLLQCASSSRVQEPALSSNKPTYYWSDKTDSCSEQPVSARDFFARMDQITGNNIYIYSVEGGVRFDSTPKPGQTYEGIGYFSFVQEPDGTKVVSVGDSELACKIAKTLADRAVSNLE